MVIKSVKKPKITRKKPIKVSKRVVKSKNFQFLTGDVNWKDYGGKWFREIDPHEYYIIEFINWENATGEEFNHGNRYYVEGRLIDLSPGSSWHKNIKNALESYGIEKGEELTEIMILEAVDGYMGGDRVYEELGNNAEKLLADCKRRMS